jgi:hypothetical protein
MNEITPEQIKQTITVVEEVKERADWVLLALNNFSSDSTYISRNNMQYTQRYTELLLCAVETLVKDIEDLRVTFERQQEK